VEHRLHFIILLQYAATVALDSRWYCSTSNIVFQEEMSDLVDIDSDLDIDIDGAINPLKPNG
jgi:hypothetical protein